MGLIALGGFAIAVAGVFLITRHTVTAE